MPALYADAVQEFMSRVGPAAYQRSSSTVASRIEAATTQVPALGLTHCADLPGTHFFREGVFRLGGPERAFATWKLDDLQEFPDGLSAAQFLIKLGPTAFARVGLYAKA